MSRDGELQSVPEYKGSLVKDAASFTTDQPYRFIGNELYAGNGLGLYDFKARLYDPATGRFLSVDPLAEKYPGIKIAVMGDMNDNPTDDSQALWLHGRETLEEMQPEDFFDPFLSMLKDGYGSLAYRGEWNIYDIVQVNRNLALAPNGGLKIQPIVKNKYYGRIFSKPFMTQQNGQYKGTPFRTFSNGAFIGGYSDHYPTYIVISK